jgi:hypothetical protein
MLRTSLTLLGLGGLAFLLFALRLVGYGPCTASFGAIIAICVAITCLPTGAILLIASGAIAAWHCVKNPRDSSLELKLR